MVRRCCLLVQGKRDHGRDIGNRLLSQFPHDPGHAGHGPAPGRGRAGGGKNNPVFRCIPGYMVHRSCGVGGGSGTGDRLWKRTLRHGRPDHQRTACDDPLAIRGQPCYSGRSGFQGRGGSFRVCAPGGVLGGGPGNRHRTGRKPLRPQRQRYPGPGGGDPDAVSLPGHPTCPCA